MVRHRTTSGLLLLTALVLAGCDRQREAPPPPPADSRPIAKGPAVAAGEDDPYAGVTAMEDRVAVLGLLNKRNGLVRDISLSPGESIRIGRAVVRLRACERTAQWESPQETGAFVQLIVLDHGSNQWRRVFSGWLFKDRPERNIVQHGIYDVFVKSCTMSWPGEVDVPSGDEAPAAASSRSSAPQSPAAAAAAPAAPADAAPAPAPTPAPAADGGESPEDTAG